MHNKCLLFNTAITSRVLYLIQPKNRVVPLQWRDNERDGLSNHQPHDCLLNRLFRHRSKKASELLVTGLCAGNSVNFPHKGPVMRKMFPFDDVILKKFFFYIGLQNQRLWSKMECFFSQNSPKGGIFQIWIRVWMYDSVSTAGPKLTPEDGFCEVQLCPVFCLSHSVTVINIILYFTTL